MRNSLTLTKKQSFFLKENRQDPVTGDEFNLGDEIVFCASCKSAFLKESWEYMNSKHCGQTFTLRKFPIQSKLKLSKPIIYDFKKPDTGKRIVAYLIDNLFAGLIAVLAYFILESMARGIAEGLSFLIGTMYMLFRDGIGIKGSLGKRGAGLYFIDTKTKKNASVLTLLFRNVLYWICLFAAISCIVFLEVAIGASGVIGSLLGFGLLIVNIINVFLTIDQSNIFDRILKIELVEKK
ncbi:RDD family protein [Bernardetia sp. ABR2-2B]|uniref:RDD family protein n=1 Tax=Bernardetia sp. ABR2-2B TaxID=3127472 RepID=UPI0030CF7517